MPDDSVFLSVAAAQVDTTGGKWTVSGGSLNDTYNLLQFHFHWGKDSKTGSEHTIDSKQYPLEVSTNVVGREKWEWGRREQTCQS